jgi:agmatinase
MTNPQLDERLRMTAGTPTLIGIHWDASSSFRRGAAAAPAAIRAALRSDAGNMWTEDLQDLSAEAALTDAGDLELPEEPAAARAAMTAGVRSMLDAGARPIVLGGDHSITYPVVKAFHSVHPKLALLHFDAHADLYDEFQGDRFSHACPFARILEEGLVDSLVQVGIRAGTGHHREQARRFGVQTITMAEFHRVVRPEVASPVYLSIDLDALDPSAVPGVSHPEPGGMTTRELLEAIQALDVPIVGADVVELNPSLDLRDLTAGVAAKLVKEVAAAMWRRV